MQSEQSQKIIGRFFQALQNLKDFGVIRGKQTFTRRYDINRWNMNSLEKEMSRDIFQVSWLGFLVEDYKVSSDWLLLGKGNFFQSGWTAEKVKNLQ